MDFRKLDSLTTRFTAFRTFLDLVNAEGGYRPTIRISGPDSIALADAYDLYQFAHGDNRIAVRDVLRDIRKPAAPRGPSKADIKRTLQVLHAHPAVYSAAWVNCWDEPAFDIQYRFPFLSTSTSQAFDTEQTCEGALESLANVYEDPTATADWEDAPDADDDDFRPRRASSLGLGL